MALKKVVDPNLLTALNTAPAPDPATVPGPKPVTDPALLAQLDAPAAPVQPKTRAQMLDEEIPQPAGVAPNNPLPEQSIWDKVKATFTGDPILNMMGHGLPTAAMGAPETIMSVADNAATSAFAGLTAPFVTDNTDDQAGYIRDVTTENFKAPQSKAGRETFDALGEAFAPVGDIKRGLGEATLDATGSPLAAMSADMLPDLAMTLGLGPVAAQEGAALPKRPLAPDPVVNPKINDLRAADIRVRPSDVRAATPGAKKVPGQFREKLADAPELKKDLTLHNQQRYTDLAAEELGVKDLTEASLAKAEAPAAATYEMAESVLRDHKVSPKFEKVLREALDTVKAEWPRGEVPTVLGTLGMLRRRATRRINSGNPESEAAGYADRNMADALDESFGAELEAAGEAQLVPQVKEARTQFAKVDDVRGSVRADHIDAEALSRLDKKFPGRLSGRLKLIADGAEYAPNVSKHSLKTAARAEAEIPDTFTGAIKGGVKKVLRKIPGMDVSAPGFQNKFGTVNKAAADSYGRKYTPTERPSPEQGEMDLESLMLEPPPGEVGVALPNFMRKPAPTRQTDAFGGEFDLQAPPGAVGREAAPVARDLGDVMIGDEPLAEPIQNFSAISLEDILGLSEPLVKKPPRRGKK